MTPTTPLGPAPDFAADTPGPRLITDSAFQGVKLPPHKLPECSGSYSDCPSFWDQFNSSSHKRKSMAKVTKLTYLRTCLKGEPLDLINGLAVTDDNYDNALKLLRSRYLDERVILREQLDAILQTPGVQPGNPLGMRKLMNAFMERTLILGSLGISQRFFLLSHLLLRKGDPDSRGLQGRAWELYRNENSGTITGLVSSS